jgi:hypothetical protein
MTVSIKQHFSHASVQEEIEFKRVMSAVLADMTAMRTAITGVTAQLDADGTVTDTDYAANNDPAALTLVS